MSLSRLSLYPLITRTLTTPTLVQGRGGSNMLVDSAGLVRQPLATSTHSCLVKAVPLPPHHQDPHHPHPGAGQGGLQHVGGQCRACKATTRHLLPLLPGQGCPHHHPWHLPG